MKKTFDDIYAAVFLTVLLAVLGGGLSFWLINHAIFSEEVTTSLDALSRRPHFMGIQYYGVQLFKASGFTNWKTQFGIGAVMGAGSSMVYLWKHRKETGDENVN